MKLSDFMRYKLSVILMHITAMIFLLLYLKIIGTGTGELWLIASFWLLFLLVFLICQYIRFRCRSKALYELMDSLDQKYLFPELLKPSWQLEERLYHDLMKQAMKSMTEQVSALRLEQEEYRSYMEQWSHEMKGPLASVDLICHNRPDTSSRKVLLQTKRIEHCLDQILYYARMEKAEQDYLIRRTTLETIADSVLSNNMQLLIQNKAQIQTADLDLTVYTDPKWMEFMLNQILLNSIRYKKDKPAIFICGRRDDRGTWLTVKDEGIGITPDELPRIFQKGFTGSNGRQYKNTTGIGLWLCKNLCEKLRIHLYAESEPGCGTAIHFLFPDQTS